MSKSRGNVISPESRLDEMGADSLRQSLLSVTLGSDFSFNWELVKYCRGFLQKFWSSIRFASRFLREYVPGVDDVEHLTTIDKWILHKLRGTINSITSHLDRYQMHSAIQILQNFVWHDFCDQYLEAVKYRLYDKLSDDDYLAVQYTLDTVLWNTTLMLAPVCPHITEEIYQTLWNRHATRSIHGLDWPVTEVIPLDSHAYVEGEQLVEALTKIRSVKSQAKIPLSQPIDAILIRAPAEVLGTLRRQYRDLTQILRIQSIEFREGADLVAEIVPQ